MQMTVRQIHLAIQYAHKRQGLLAEKMLLQRQQSLSQAVWLLYVGTPSKLTYVLQEPESTHPHPLAAVSVGELCVDAGGC